MWHTYTHVGANPRQNYYENFVSNFWLRIADVPIIGEVWTKCQRQPDPTANKTDVSQSHAERACISVFSLLNDSLPFTGVARQVRSFHFSFQGWTKLLSLSFSYIFRSSTTFYENKNFLRKVDFYISNRFSIVLQKLYIIIERRIL